MLFKEQLLNHIFWQVFVHLLHDGQTVGALLVHQIFFTVIVYILIVGPSALSLPYLLGYLYSHNGTVL